MENIIFKPIGMILSPFEKPEGTPIQPAAAKGIEGSVEVFPQYEEGLQDLDGFSHIILLYYLHLSKSFSLKVKPFMDNQLRGLFATRAPSRPNGIGLSVVRLENLEGNILRIKDVDIVNGTPLLDIKPYVGEFDKKENFRKGWLEKNVEKLPDAKDDGRFIS